jgi:hypothetical protein
MREYLIYRNENGKEKLMPNTFLHSLQEAKKIVKDTRDFFKEFYGVTSGTYVPGKGTLTFYYRPADEQSDRPKQEVANENPPQKS